MALCSWGLWSRDYHARLPNLNNKGFNPAAFFTDHIIDKNHVGPGVSIPAFSVAEIQSGLLQL